MIDNIIHCVITFLPLKSFTLPCYIQAFINYFIPKEPYIFVLFIPLYI